MTPPRDNVSGYSRPKEKDASEIEYINKTEDGLRSFLGSKGMEDEQEMQANISHVRGDLSVGKSMNATELEYLNRSQNMGGVKSELPEGERDGT